MSTRGGKSSRYSKGSRFHVWAFRVAAALAVALFGTALVVLLVDGPGDGPIAIAVMGAVAAVGAYAYRTDDGTRDDSPPDWPSNLHG